MQLPPLEPPLDPSAGLSASRDSGQEARVPLRTLRQRHDETYRKIFGDRHMMLEFIRGFLPLELLEGWDLETLEIKNTQWVNRRLERRNADLVWRLRRREAEDVSSGAAIRATGHASGQTRASSQARSDWIYLYLMLEHQSRSDHRMPLRELEYVVLFLNALIDAGEIPASGPYPVVLPIVLYNGRRPWRAGTSLRHYQAPMPEALRPFNPALEFLLIDLNALDSQRLRSLASACAVFFQMEREDSLAGLTALIPRLDELLPEETHLALRRTLATWIHEVAILSRGGRIDEALLQTQTLSEVHTMLAERVKDWFADARRQGLQEGRLQGRQEGRQEGHQEGLQEGEVKGKIEGAALLLQTLLQQKFGPLPQWAQARIAGADADTLQQWALKVLPAERLEAVFES